MNNKKTIRNSIIAVALLALTLLLCACAPGQEDGDNTQPLCLSYREVNVTVGAPIEELLNALGEDYTMEEAASCAGIGKDYIYTYPSLRIYVFAPEGGVAVVTSACYTDDGAAHKGVTIGSGADAVVAALGQPDEKTDSRITYKADGVTLTFTLRDGAVSAVVLSEE